jgi:hypothetical protein
MSSFNAFCALFLRLALEAHEHNNTTARNCSPSAASHKDDKNNFILSNS